MSIPVSCILIIAFPVGKLMAATLPSRPVKILGTRWAIPMNPGPFNVKEHILISVLANAGTDYPYALVIVSQMKAFFHRKINPLVALLVTQTSQLLGYGFAGLFIKLLVESPYMWWPALLSNVTFYRTLHEKATDAFYKLSNTRAQIQAYVFDVIRASVPKLNLDDTFEQKNDIATAVENELEKAMSHYGFEIVQTLIVDIVPDERVKKAMNEINAAARLRLAANENAEADKILQIKWAEGKAESKYLSGLGIARQRQAIVDGLRDSVLAFSVNVPGTTSKDVMDMVLVTQYFDTMKEIGASSKSSAVFIPHRPGAVKDIATQIRDGLLQASARQ